MIKTTLKFSLLTIATLFAAISGKAQTVIYERGGDGTAWSSADLEDWTASYCTPTIDGGLNVSSTNGGWTVTKAIKVTDKTIVKLNADLKTGGPGGNSGSYDYIKMGGVSIRFNEQNKKASVDIDDVETDMSITYNRGSVYNVTITIDQDSHHVSALIGTASISGTSTTAISNVEFGHYKAGRENYGINPILQSIQISEETSSTTYYDYTVNAVDGNNNVLKELQSGTVESTSHPLNVFFPQYVLAGTKLYQATKGSSNWYQTSLTIDQDDYVYNIPYTTGTVDDVVFYTEAEDVEGTSKGSNAARASFGAMGHTGSSYVNATTLEPGKYQIFMRGVNGNNSSRAVSFKVGDNVVFTTDITKSTTNFLDNSETFSVTSTSTLSFSSEGSSQSGVDWFYVKYMGELDKGEYTVKFMLDDNTTELKDAETRNGAIGTVPTIYDSDKEMFTIDEVTYIYDSDDAAGQTIAEDGSTVVTIIYRVAVPLAYQVVAVDGNGTQLAVVAEGELYEGETTTAYYTKAVEKDGQWYMIAQNAAAPYYGVTVSGGQTVNKTYSPSDIIWFSEIEDLRPSHSWAANGDVLERYANGMAKRLYKNSYVKIGNFDSGIYSVTLRARNRSSSQTATLPLFLVDANGDLGEEAIGTFGEWAKAGQAEFTIENVTIPAGCGLALNNNTEWNSNLELDYIYLTRTGDLPPVEVTISKYGYSTLYYSDRNLVVPEGLTAYAVTVDGKKATMQDVGSVISAGTGVVLEGTANKSYTLTATSEKGTAVENILKGTDETTDISDAGYKYYMLSVRDNNAHSVGFYYQVAGGESITNEAHRAYLAIESEPSNPEGQGVNGLPLFEQTDGIGTIESVSTENNDTYTLSGIRVSGNQLQKGVYVRNGKISITK